MDLGDTGNSASDYRASRERVDRLSKLRERPLSVRQKEYLVPPYAKRYRETHTHPKSFMGRNQQWRDDKTSLHLNKPSDEREMVNGRSQFATFGSSRTNTLSKSTLRTNPLIEKSIKYADVPSRPLGKSYLEELDKEPPDVVAEVFHKRHEDFVKVLKRCSKDKTLINIMFSIFAKITKAKGEHLIHLSSVLRDSLFIENIAASYLLSLVGRGSDHVVTVRNVICILRYIAEYSYTSVTPFLCAITALSELSKEIRSSDLCTSDIKSELDEFDHIRSKINTMRIRQRKKARTKEDEMLPPDSFRLVNISPTAEELLTNRIPFLRKNKDIGSYNDLEHYLDVQFRLMREDFVAPLRESINDFKSNVEDIQNRTLKLQDVRIYTDVKIVDTTTSYDGISHVLIFDKADTQKVNWEISKRLIYGSLLCLSYDSFETIYIATVTNRDPSNLKEGMIDVQFTCDLQTVRGISGKTFIMAESATLFEAYKHNLTALQLIQDLPFSRYIVECEDDINPPAYLLRNEETYYDFTILSEEFIDEMPTEKDRINGKQSEGRQNHLVSTRKRDKTFEKIDILNDNSWPSPAKLGMDESQHRALKNALTHEFSITQGPPGTGKTFIGLKVARALLANKEMWSAGKEKHALLVVCYTNHALDQFLCGIHRFYKDGNIVRIGGRSANEEMKQHSIQTLFKYTTPDVKDALTAAYDNANTTKERINELKDQIYNLDRGFVKMVDIGKYMGQFQNELEKGFEYQLKNIYKNEDLDNAIQRSDLIREWLGYGEILPTANIGIYFVDRKTPRRKSKGISDTVAYHEILPINEMSKGKIRKIWKTSFHTRLELYKSWVEALKTDLTETLQEYEDNFIRYSQEIKHVTRQKHIEALRQADVIGMTTTGAAMNYEVLQSIKPKIVIVEEAAEVLEGHIVTSLSDECEHLILIGDHKQLRPSPAVYELAKKYNLDLSLFERMINNRVKYESLEIQHRMRPEIADIIRLIYPYLKDHESVLNKPCIWGVSKNVFFVTHQQAEDDEEDTLSHLNKHEAEFVVGLCRYLLKQGYKPCQITVLTTYSAQMFHLQKLMLKDSVFAGVNITVVDNYQGEENEIVILSLVRSNADKKVGFLKTENRINVALSRARNGLYVIGNMQNFAEASETWTKIVALLQKEEHIGPAIPLFCRNHPDTKLGAKTIKDFDYAPEGGCNLNCDARLECGHVCELKCHVYDTDHKEYKCEKSCIKACPQNDHPCTKKCHEDCGDCMIPVVKMMPKCGHEQTMPCSQDPLKWDCQAMCERICRRKHPCKKRCFEDCSFCPVEMVKTLPQCGHKHTMPCSMHRAEWKCMEDCERICKNGHLCNKRCYKDCRQCDVIVQRRLTKCGHDQMMPCYMDESKWKCKENCEKTCENNHKCEKLCSETCKCTIEITKDMPDCRHMQTMPCYVQPRNWKCKAPCDGKLECGHECPSLCSDSVTKHNSFCTKNKSKMKKENDKLARLPPVFRLDFVLLRMNSHCYKDCEFILECGHKCTRKCYEAHVAKCAEKINIVFDKCGHSNEMPCYRRNMKNDCFKPCDFILDCGHKCKMKWCYEPHTTICEYRVVKERKCGHSYRIKCHEDVEAFKCYQPCEYTLDCGHKCRRRCSDSHTRYCTEEIEMSLPCCERKVHVQCREDIEKLVCPFPCQEKLECGHPCTNKCNKPHTSFCKVVVSKPLPCGHIKDLFCGVNVDTLECTRHCKTILSCGHSCKNTCAEPHTSECAEIVTFECGYGHKTTAPCHKIYTKQGAKCQHKCHRKLKCGHPCSGSCFECKGGVFHKMCSLCPLPDFTNHASAHMAKEGIPCLAKCQNKCDHKVCEKLCYEPCAEDGKVQWPCEEKCNAQCEHFKCQKRSFGHGKNEFCSETYEIIASIAENMSKPRDFKRRIEINKSHRTCGAVINTRIVEAALKQHVKSRHRKSKEINETTCLKIADKLHEYEEKEKRSSQFYANHTRLHERLFSLESMLEAMDQTTDLYKIYKCRLEFNRENFKNWYHFQKQGYKDLEKEFDRLQRMARTILSIDSK